MLNTIHCLTSGKKHLESLADASYVERFLLRIKTCSNIFFYLRRKPLAILVKQSFRHKNSRDSSTSICNKVVLLTLVFEKAYLECIVPTSIPTAAKDHLCLQPFSEKYIPLRYLYIVYDFLICIVISCK